MVFAGSRTDIKRKARGYVKGVKRDGKEGEKIVDAIRSGYH